MDAMDDIKAGNQNQIICKGKGCEFPIPPEAMVCPGCGTPRPTDPYGCALRWVFLHDDLNAPAKSLYGLLASFASYRNGRLDMSVSGIAKVAGMSRSAVNRALKQLQKAGAIKRTSGHKEWGRWWVALGHLEYRVPEMALKNAKSVSKVALRIRDRNGRLKTNSYQGKGSNRSV